MRDFGSWSLPVMRVRGITVRVHLILIIFIVAMVGRGFVGGYAGEALLMMAILFISVLLHEFGHCFAARRVDGDATEILLWPLGGLASVDVPNTPRAHFITVIWGPLVNLILCFAAGAALLVSGLIPPMWPTWSPIVTVVERQKEGTKVVSKVTKVMTGPLRDVHTWQLRPYQVTETEDLGPARISETATIQVIEETASINLVQSLLARFFFVNWILFWFNVLLVGFPLDGGRILQCILWPQLGFRQATRIAIYCGYGVVGLIVLYVLMFASGDGVAETMLLCLGFFIFLTCFQQQFLLESGALGEEGLFGYDFSQGYTSLERDQPQPRRSKPNFIQRWLQRRAARKKQREEEQRLAEERRLDELLAKVQRDGKESLTNEERRFLERVSARFRNRNRS